MKKTVLITGASRGIGKICSIIFAQKGYNIAINYNTSDSDANKLKDDIILNGGTAEIYQADVSSYQQVADLVKRVYHDFGRIDVLINNAGISMHKVFTDVTCKEWEKICGVNLSGAIYCCREVIPHMLRHGKGRIINISSIWGERGASCETHYSVTKAAIIGLTKALSKEYASAGINVNCIAPGCIDTDMLSEFDEDELNKLIERTPCGRLGTGFDIAKVALFLASHESDFVTGQIIGVNGGFE